MLINYSVLTWDSQPDTDTLSAYFFLSPTSAWSPRHHFASIDMKEQGGWGAF